MMNIDDSKLLNVISKVLEKKQYISSEMTGVSDDIYKKINDLQCGLSSEICDLSFPASPELVKGLNSVVSISDYLAGVPFLHGKKTVYLSCRETGCNISLFESIVNGQIEWIKKFSQIRTNHIIMICNSEVPVIYAKNNNGYPAELSMEEYETLVSGCYKKSIPLYKLVKYFIVGLPLKYDIAFILEGKRQSYAFNSFRPIICDCVSVANAPFDEKKDKDMSAFRILINASKRLQEIKSSFEVAKNVSCNIITSEQFFAQITKDLRPAYVSLYDRFLEVASSAEIWYRLQLSSMKKIIEAFQKDIIRTKMNDEDENCVGFLRKRQKEDKKKEKLYRSELIKIQGLLNDIGNSFKKIDKILCPKETGEYFIMRSSIDPVLKTMFSYADNGVLERVHNELMPHLRSLHYEEISFAEQYVSGCIKCNTDVSSWNKKWENAKYFLNSTSLSDVSNGSDEFKAQVSYALKCMKKNRVPYLTEKELFFSGWVEKNEFDKIRSYKSAVYKGSQDAAEELWSVYQKNKSYYLMKDLADFLFPPACFELSRQKNKNRKVHNFEDKSIVYYKLLAAKGDTVSMSKIVDIIYNSKYNLAIPIKEENEERINVAKKLIYLCNELIACGFNVGRYTEIKGVLLFSLDMTNSDAYDCLNEYCSTTAGFFCLGRIYQYGNGRVAKNLEKAVSMFTVCLDDNDFSERARNYINMIQCWRKNDLNRAKNIKTDYTPVTRCVNVNSNSDGCVTGDTLITMGDGSVKRADEIKDTDLIMAWNIENGGLVSSKMMAFHKSVHNDEHNVIHVHFDDGTTVSVIGEHLFFDFNLSRFIAFTDGADNSVYIGHTFAKIKGDSFIKVLLTEVTVSKEVCMYYAPISERYLTCITNGMISANSHTLPLCNRFDFDKAKICFDSLRKEKDFKQYSVFSYDKVKDIISKDFFEKNLGSEFGVAIGKGLISQQELIELITKYRNIFYDTSV